MISHVEIFSVLSKNKIKIFTKFLRLLLVPCCSEPQPRPRLRSLLLRWCPTLAPACGPHSGRHPHVGCQTMFALCSNYRSRSGRRAAAFSTASGAGIAYSNTPRTPQPHIYGNGAEIKNNYSSHKALERACKTYNTTLFTYFYEIECSKISYPSLKQIELRFLAMHTDGSLIVWNPNRRMISDPLLAAFRQTVLHAPVYMRHPFGLFRRSRRVNGERFRSRFYQPTVAEIYKYQL